MKFNKFIFVLFPWFIIANPTGEKVVHGEADFKRDDNSVFINQNTDKTIIEWKDFSINSDEITKFIQPSSSSKILNRVTGNDISKIYGRLEGNGKIYLINQKGILIGPDGKINTNGFIASTLDLENSEFLNNKDLNFSSDLRSSIKNLGTIDGLNGEVILIAPIIENLGEIRSKNNNVSMLASANVLLKEDGADALVKSDSLIDNKGSIEAVQVKLNASNGNIYSLAINQEGIIKAQGIQEKEGKVFLIADGKVDISGQIISNDQNGGVIHILGDEIHIKDNAIIDASSEKMGGEILIGGDYQGKNQSIKNAKILTTSKTATIDASAKVEGNGGKVIFWSDDLNLYEGNTLAKGGNNAGDGGFVEISCLKDLQFRGKVDTSALNGVYGNVLLDPSNIAIWATASSVPPLTANYNPGPGEQNPCYVYSGHLSTLLNSSSVSISTSNGSSGSGFISIDNNVIISWSAATTLTIIADRNIAVGTGGAPSITSTYTGSAIGPFAVFLQGKGIGSASYTGISLQNLNITTNSSSNGGVCLEGVGGTSGTNHGVSLSDSKITTNGGDIIIFGEGASSANTTLEGVLIIESSLKTNSGSIVITGTGGSGTNNCYGIALWECNPVYTAGITTTSGEIRLDGTAGGIGLSGIGSYLYNSVLSSTSGIITVRGTGSGSSGPGIQMTNGTTKITSEGGAISLTGLGAGTGVGIKFDNGLIEGKGSSDISLAGYCPGAPTNTGISLASSAIINNNTGKIILKNDIYSYSTTTKNFNTSGGLEIQAYNSGTSIGIGSGTGTLVIPNTTLQWNSTNVGSVSIGQPNGSHVVQIGGITTLSKNLSVYGNTISTVGNINIAAKNLSLNMGSASAGTCTINNYTYSSSGGNYYVNGTSNYDHALKFSYAGLYSSNLWYVSADYAGYVQPLEEVAPVFNFTGIKKFDSGAGLSNFYQFLEAYKLVSITGGTGLDVTNTLSMDGIASSNSWSITTSNGHGFLNPGGVGNIEFTNITDLLGGDGDDTFTLNDGLGVLGVINGGVTGNNTLDYSAYTSAVTITLPDGNATGTGSGITNINKFIGGSGNDTVDVTGEIIDLTETAGTNVINVGANVTGTITGGSGDDSFVFADGITISGTINGGTSGSNTLDYSAYTTSTDITLSTYTSTGASGTDGSITAGFSNITSILGGFAPNILTGVNSGNTFNITGNNSGNAGDGTNSVNFTSFGTINGGNGDDSFVFADGMTISGTIDGGAGGTNTLDYSAYITSTDVILNAYLFYGVSGADGSITAGFTNIKSIIGGSASNTLMGVSSGNTFNITGSNSGSVSDGGGPHAAFASFGTLSGGIGNDTFNLSSGSVTNINGNAGTNTYNLNGGDVTGQITGGSGNDSFIFANGATVTGAINGGTSGTNALDFFAYTTSIDVTISSYTSTGASGTNAAIAGGFSNITDLFGRSSNTLTGTNSGNIWNMTGIAQGNVGDGTNSVNYTNFYTLIGGSGDDTFNVLGTISGSINGGVGGVNKINYTNAVNITISGYTATGAGGTDEMLTGFSNITDITGGAGSNTFTGSSSGNIFNITGNDSGDAGDGTNGVNFVSFGTLIGRSGIDTFRFHSNYTISGNLDGGITGANTIDYNSATAYSSLVSINLQAATATGIGGTFSNISSFIGPSTFSSANTIIGKDTGGNWDINANDGGTASDGTTFTNFGNLTGGSGADTFR
ncbi:MAG: filamentous hemagglutinin N-terminal domain-containing protein, partial [Parachlamydiales bacterium]